MAKETTKKAVRLVLAGALSMALLAGLAACSDDDEPDDSSPGSVSASSSTATLVAYGNNNIVDIDITLSGTAFACDLGAKTEVTNLIQVWAGNDKAESVTVRENVSANGTSAKLRATIQPTSMESGRLSVLVKGPTLTTRRDLSTSAGAYSVVGAMVEGHETLNVTPGKSVTKTYTVRLTTGCTFADNPTINISDDRDDDKKVFIFDKDKIKVTRKTDTEAEVSIDSVKSKRSTAENGSLVFTWDKNSILLGDKSLDYSLRCTGDANYRVEGATATAEGSLTALYGNTDSFNESNIESDAITISLNLAKFDSDTKIEVSNPSDKVTDIKAQIVESTGTTATVKFVSGKHSLMYDGDEVAGNLHLTIEEVQGDAGDTLSLETFVPYELIYAPDDHLSVPSAQDVQTATMGKTDGTVAVTVISLDARTENKKKSLSQGIDSNYTGITTNSNGVTVRPLRAVSAGATEIPVRIESTAPITGSITLNVPGEILSSHEPLTIKSGTSDKGYIMLPVYDNGYENGDKGAWVSKSTDEKLDVEATRYTPTVFEEVVDKVVNKYLSVNQSTAVLDDGGRYNNGCRLFSTELSEANITEKTSFVISFKLKVGCSNNQSPTTFYILDKSDDTEAPIFKLAATGANVQTWYVNDGSESLYLPGTGTGLHITNLTWYTVTVEQLGTDTTFVTIRDPLGQDVLVRTKVDTLCEKGGLGRIQFDTSRYNANFAIDDIMVCKLL